MLQATELNLLNSLEGFFIDKTFHKWKLKNIKYDYYKDINLIFLRRG